MGCPGGGVSLAEGLGIVRDDEPYVSGGFNTHSKLPVKANFLKPETKSSSGKLRRKKTPKL